MIPLPEDLSVKIARAERHVRELDDACRSFADSGALELVPVEGEGHVPEFSSWGVKVRQIKPTPTEIPAIFGDAIQCIRSTLEYLARALVESNGGTPMDKAGAAGTTFPVVNTSPPKGLQIGGGVDPGALSLVEDLQPYQGPRSDREGLARLHSLSVADKHRVLQVVTSGTALPSALLLYAGSSVAPYGVVSPLMRWVKGGEWAIMPMIPLPIGAQGEVWGA